MGYLPEWLRSRFRVRFSGLSNAANLKPGNFSGVNARESIQFQITPNVTGQPTLILTLQCRKVKKKIILEINVWVLHKILNFAS